MSRRSEWYIDLGNGFHFPIPLPPLPTASVESTPVAINGKKPKAAAGVPKGNYSEILLKETPYLVDWTGQIIAAKKMTGVSEMVGKYWPFR